MHAAAAAGLAQAQDVAMIRVLIRPMSRYASNQEVARFFAEHGIEVTHVRREGDLRHLRVHGQPLTLPMPASAEECLTRVRESLALAADGHNTTACEVP